MVSNEGMMKHNRKKMVQALLPVLSVLPQTDMKFQYYFLLDSLSCIIKCTHPLLQYEIGPQNSEC